MKRFKEVMVMMLKRFLELPKKYAVGNLNLVCYVLIVGESYVAGGGRDWVQRLVTRAVWRKV